MRSAILATSGLVWLLLAPLGCRAYWNLPEPRPRDGSARVVEVAFESPGGAVVVPVRIGDDPTPRRFVVDTERWTTVISPALADRLGIRPRHVRYGDHYFATYRDWVPIARLPSLRIGDLELRGGKAEVTDLNGLSQRLCQPIDGVLGIRSPNHLAFEIDHAAGVLRIARSAALLPPRTGGILANDIDLVLPDGSGVLGPLAVASTYLGAIEAEYETSVWLAAARDGGALTGRVSLSSSSVGELRLGAAILRAFTVRTGFSELLLFPNGRPLPASDLGLGFEWVLDGGAAIVRKVHDSTRALGLKNEDRLLAIDDQPIAELTPEARCVLQRDWPGDRERVRLTIDRSSILDTSETDGTTPPTLTIEVARHSLRLPPAEPPPRDTI